jgi:hypothetical protein
MADSAVERDDSEIVIWIPYDNDPEYKATITLKDSTVLDISDDLDEGTVTLVGPPNISTFSGVINNSDGTYSDKLTGGEVLSIYIERAVDPTVLVFEGHIDYPGKTSADTLEIKLLARSHEVVYQDTKITKSYYEELGSDILIDLLTYKTSEFGTSGITTTPGTTISIEFEDTPILDAISQVLDKIGHSLYFTPGKEAISYVTGSVENTDDAFVSEQNIFYVSGFGPDTSQVVNKVRVSGTVDDGVPILGYYEDQASINEYGEKELSIKDTTISTQLAADERALAEVLLRKDAPEVGEVQGMGAETLKPGQKINIYSPYDGVDGSYIANKIMYDLRTIPGITTTVTVQKEIRRLSSFIKLHDTAIRTATSSYNANDMNYSWTFPFNDSTDIQTLIDCAIASGAVTSSSSSASLQTTAKYVANTPTDGVFLLKGEGLGSATLEYSLDAGATFTTVQNNTAFSISGYGNQIVLRVSFGANGAKIDTMSFLWK